jgi:hypothetical protein
MRSVAVLSLLILFISTTAYADIYKYVDENGVDCYTDTPLNKKAHKVHKENSTSPAIQQKHSRTEPKRNTDYHDIVYEKAATYDVDPSLIKAVIKTESNWNDRAVSRKGAMGLMQLMPSTANDMNVRNPFDPEENIEGGTKYLKYLIGKFNGDLTLALAAYNAGPKTVEKFGYVPPITETRQYVKKVLSHYDGKSIYVPSVNDSSTKGNKRELIYKIVLDDGTVMFTNSSLFSKNTARF